MKSEELPVISVIIACYNTRRLKKTSKTISFTGFINR